MTQSWDPDFAARLPLFAPLGACAGRLPAARWPDCADLNALAAAGHTPPVNAAGMPIRFVPQPRRPTAFEEKYEPRIFLRGEVLLRAANWHDLFNALVWLVFPRTKAALNRRHYEALCAQRAAGAVNRGPQQDALTLFDEGGIVVAAANPDLAAMLRAHDWKALFWQRRAEARAAMGYYLFGHALYEKALQPYAGVTGRGVILACAADFFARPLAAQLEEIDLRLAGLLAADGSFAATGELAPVPILGIPGWCAENEDASYYDNAAYFRPPPLRTRDRR
jgi:hypothetical protein